jgi:hypothetical protein
VLRQWPTVLPLTNALFLLQNIRSMRALEMFAAAISDLEPAGVLGHKTATGINRFHPRHYIPPCVINQLVMVRSSRNNSPMSVARFSPLPHIAGTF